MQGEVTGARPGHVDWSVESEGRGLRVSRGLGV